jgi:putative sterol carrier protein
VIDLKSGSGSVSPSSGSAPADCIIGMKDGEFVLLMTGRLNPQSAFMKGKLKVKGNLMLAQKLNALMPSKKKKQQQQPPAGEEEEGGAAGDEKQKIQSRL